MLLHEIKIIDLNRSEWNKKTAKPDEGLYDFTKKEYVNNDRKESRTDWRFEWVPFSKQTNYREYYSYKVKYGADFVRVGDPYVPEGVPPDEEGKYIFMNDVVLLKYPLLTWLRKQDAASKKSMRLSKDKVSGFEDMMRAQGAALPSGFAEEFAEKRLGEDKLNR